jgi:hypothetical protein
MQSVGASRVQQKRTAFTIAADRTDRVKDLCGAGLKGVGEEEKGEERELGGIMLRRV